MEVIKRDGSKQKYEVEKIKKCLEKANNSVEEEERVEGQSLTKLIKSIQARIAEASVYDISNGYMRDLTVEEIQDIIEDELIRIKKSKLAKNYIKYRYQHQKARDAANTLIDYKKVMDNYLKVNDWRVKENSTVSYSLGGLILSNSGAVTANYWLSEIYDEEIANAHRNADIHLHDLSMLSGYCFTGDTRVKTLDGKNPTFKELVDNQVNELYVFSYDTESKKIVPAKAINPRVTRVTDGLVKITLATGETITCTKDHPFMLRDGTYLEAQYLKPNMSLMPLYIGENGKYISINKAWHNQKENLYLHRWLAEQYLGRPLLEDEVVHHLDGDKHNNTPENLVVIKDKEHRSLEVKETMKSDKWKIANNERLVSYNKSKEKREECSIRANNRNRDNNGRFISAFSYNENKDQNHVNFNHSVRKVELLQLDSPIEVYDLTVPEYHNFAIGGNVFVHNCAGWSLKQLIQEGLGGVTGKITSRPASHLHTLCNQMVNFLGIMQNEWAGAQAFSSFDTYLAPFVKVDNLTYKEVKQCIQSFVFGVNTPSRWGCVDEDTEVLSVNGFKKYNELKEDEFIYTWNMDTGILELNPVRKVVVKPFKGKLHSYKARGYNQTVTPEHRMLIKKHNKDDYLISHSENIFNVKTPYYLPVAFKDSSLKKYNISEEEIQLAASIYTDGSFDMRNNSVHKITIFKSPNRFGNEMIINACKKLGLNYSFDKSNGQFGEVNKYVFYGDAARFLYNLTGGKNKIDKKFLQLDKEQSLLFLYTWSKFDGRPDRFRLQYDNDEIASQLQHIALRAGKCSYLYKDSKSQYVKVRTADNVSPSAREEVEYDGIVWCPNVENGTAVFRKDGCVYISGQCQAPFSNITLDWTVPNDLAELNCIVGGKEMGFRYKDCQKEMDMINKAFLEVMIEGDANGRGFQYPIEVVVA